MVGRPREHQTVATSFAYEKVDLFLPDLIPIALTRSYRPGDPVTREFGIGARHPYSMYLWRPNFTYETADLILSDGKRIHYVPNPQNDSDCVASGFSRRKWLPLNLLNASSAAGILPLPSLRQSYGGSAKAFSEGGKPEATATNSATLPTEGPSRTEAFLVLLNS